MTRTCLTCGRNFDAESAVTICGRCEFEADCKPKPPHECRPNLCACSHVWECPTCGTKVTLKTTVGGSR